MKMKLITAIIKPFMIDKLSRTLTKAPVTGFTVTEGRGYGRGGREFDLLTPRARFEIVLLEEHVKEVQDLIFKTVSTHRDGDGIMFVSDVQSVTNIHTGQIDEDALVIS